MIHLRDLTVAFAHGNSWIPVLRDVDLSVFRGEIVGLVGESGAGKTLTALSILDLLPAGARIVSGSVEFDSTGGHQQEPHANERPRDRVRMVFQEPASALNPVLSIGFQIAEGLTEKGWSRKRRLGEACRLLSLVGIAGARQRLYDYPHQLSGGQRQRVLIAMALAAEPDLLIADEPTSALDITVQAQILDLLSELRSALGLAILLITHDLSIVRDRCDRVVVMYAGQVVEQGEAPSVLANPLHPYTRALVAATPRVGVESRSTKLPTLPGEAPDPRELPDGCSFHPRCGEALPACRSMTPRLVSVPGRHQARCVLQDEAFKEEASS